VHNPFWLYPLFQLPLFCLFIKALRDEGVEVVISSGNHELQNPIGFVLSTKALIRDGAHVISNLSPFIKQNLTEDDTWENVVNNSRIVSVEMLDLGITDAACKAAAPNNDVQEMCTRLGPLEQFCIIGNTLYFPHICANGTYSGGGYSDIVPLILQRDFWESLSPLFPKTKGTRERESWAQWATDHGQDHPMLVETANALCDAIRQLFEQYPFDPNNPDDPVNLIIMSHATRLQTIDFLNPLFAHYGKQIMEAFGCQENFARTRIRTAGGHHHYVFDQSTEGETKEFPDDGPYIVPIVLDPNDHMWQKECRFTASQMFTPNAHVIFVPQAVRDHVHVGLIGDDVPPAENPQNAPPPANPVLGALGGDAPPAGNPQNAPPPRGNTVRRNVYCAAAVVVGAVLGWYLWRRYREASTNG
jgi:hypothetical protein